MYNLFIFVCICYYIGLLSSCLRTFLSFVVFLIANQQEKPTRVFISRVKPEEQQRKDKRQYRRVKKWELTELRIVDGRSQDTEVRGLLSIVNSY